VRYRKSEKQEGEKHTRGCVLSDELSTHTESSVYEVFALVTIDTHLRNMSVSKAKLGRAPMQPVQHHKKI
jgi:hypothetical protein